MDKIIKQRGRLNLATYGLNIVQFIQNNIDSLNVGIYDIDGTQATNILTDWGRLILYSKIAAIFIGLNSKELLILSKDSTKWHYTIFSGESGIGPF